MKSMRFIKRNILLSILVGTTINCYGTPATGFTAQVIKQAKNSTKYCAGEKIPNKNLVCAYDIGIFPNTNKDSSELLQIALETIPSTYEGIFFPAGKYKIDKDIVLTLSNRNSIIGSLTYKTVFYHEDAEGFAGSIGNGDFGTNVTNLTIQNIIFDNIKVNFYGHKKYMTIKDNAFINTGFYYDTNKKQKWYVPQISLSHYPSNIVGNVLMRGEKTPGIGIRSYRNGYYNTPQDLIIEGNFLGNLEAGQHAKLYISDETKGLITSLRELSEQGIIEIKGDQGNYVTGWLGDTDLKRVIFKHNYIAGNTLNTLYNPNNGKYDWIRDHIVYLRGYDGVDVIQNYFSGWPSSSNGQVKMRNAENLVFAANYLDNTNLDMRAYGSQDKLFLRNTYIFNNYVTNGVLNYWQNCTNYDNYQSASLENATTEDLKDLQICMDTSGNVPTSIDVKNYLVFSNAFKKRSLEQMGNDIETTWRNGAGEFFSSSNLAVDAIQHGDATVSHMFKEISLEEIRSKVPYSKHDYFSYHALSVDAH